MNSRNWVRFSVFLEVAIQTPITRERATARIWWELSYNKKINETSAHTMAQMILTFSECRLAREVSPRGSRMNPPDACKRRSLITNMTSSKDLKRSSMNKEKSVKSWD